MLTGSKRNNILHHAVRHFTWRCVAEKAQAALCAVRLFFLAVRPQRPVKLHRIHVLTSNRMNCKNICKVCIEAIFPVDFMAFLVYTYYIL